MPENLENYIITESAQEVVTILERKNFAEFLTRHKGSDGNFFFRVRDSRMTIGRSKGFVSRQERDRVFEEFVDWIEIELHDNLQRVFEF